MEACEIDVAAVHDVEGAGFQSQWIQGIDIVNFSVGKVDKAGDDSSQVD